MTENSLFLRSLVFQKGFSKSEINLLRREPRSTFLDLEWLVSINFMDKHSEEINDR